MAVKAVPDGYSTVTPYLIVRGAARAIEFYKAAFGAAELFRMELPGGKLGHAEIQLGNARVMLADEFPERGIQGPETLGGAGVHLLLYVDDVDSRFQQAVSAGATVTRPLANQFYGDRSGTIADPFGHVWTIATHVEDVSPEEMEKRSEAFMKQQSA
jgi:PhnB protein